MSEKKITLLKRLVLTNEYHYCDHVAVCVTNNMEGHLISKLDTVNRKIAQCERELRTLQDKRTKYITLQTWHDESLERFSTQQLLSLSDGITVAGGATPASINCTTVTDNEWHLVIKAVAASGVVNLRRIETAVREMLKEKTTDGTTQK